MTPNIKTENLFLQGKLQKMIDIFWKKLCSLKLSETDCWLRPNAKGWYGVVGCKGFRIKAHRLSYMIHYGKIPDGLRVLHSCPTGDNPSCVNPYHLRSGTESENMRDMYSRGRIRVRGEDHSNAKLNNEAVNDIRTSDQSYSSLAKKYGICKQHVYRVRHYIRWV